MVTTKKLATSGVLHTLSHFIVLGVLFILGKFYFGEKYSSKEVMGLLFGVLSIYILVNEPNSHGHSHEHGHDGHEH